MGFEIHIRTGFFETRTYYLLIEPRKLVFRPTEAEKPVLTISNADLLCVTLRSKKQAEIEILSRDKIYKGVLVNKSDFEDLLNQLKMNLTKKIVCEYEGGN